MSGVVVNAAGAPVAGARVYFVRQALVSEHERTAILGNAATDADGRLDFGRVALHTEVEFPLETAVRYEYGVTVNGRERVIDAVRFTAPRKDGVVASVSVEIRVR